MLTQNVPGRRMTYLLLLLKKRCLGEGEKKKSGVILFYIICKYADMKWWRNDDFFASNDIDGMVKYINSNNDGMVLWNEKGGRGRWI